MVWYKKNTHTQNVIQFPIGVHAIRSVAVYFFGVCLCVCLYSFIPRFDGPSAAEMYAYCNSVLGIVSITVSISPECNIRRTMLKH